MGIETELDGLPAETLGGLRLGVSPLEMTNAYATLASGGIRNKPIAIKKVTFPDGHVDELGDPERERVFPDGVAYEVTQILEDNVDAGTGTAAGTGCGDEAGKTGTTDDFNDAMFMGYTPHLRPASGSAIPTPDLDDLGARDLGRGRHLPGDDLARLHVGGPGRPLRGLPRARGSGRVDPLQRRVQLGLRLRLQLGLGRRHRRLEGSYGCGSYDDSLEDSGEGDSDDGAYAPGVGQKPAPKPSAPKPDRRLPPPPPPPPSGGVTP